MTTTALKIIALISMTIDHVGRFILGAPFVLRMVGRVSRPLFVFCACHGFDHTRSREKYLIRLYGFSVLMGVMCFVLNCMFPQRHTMATNNIFATLLIILLFVHLSDISPGKEFIFFLYNLIASAVHAYAPYVLGRNAMLLLGGVLPCVHSCEGGLMFAFLGLIIYSAKDSRLKLISGYGGFCIIYMLAVLLVGFRQIMHNPAAVFSLLFSADIQWMMIFALPFMLCYNGQKGKGLKWLFYIYYPVHIAVLFIVGNMIK